MLEQRVARLEEQGGRIERILETLAPKITEIQARMATQADIAEIKREVAGLNNRISVMDGRFEGINDRFDGISGRFDGINGRLEGIDKRIAGVEGRFSQVPTIWGMLGILATLLIGLTGIIFTVGKYLH